MTKTPNSDILPTSKIHIFDTHIQVYINFTTYVTELVCEGLVSFLVQLPPAPGGQLLPKASEKGRPGPADGLVEVLVVP